MGQPTSLFSERVAVLAAIDPDAYTANAYTSGWVKADLFHKYVAIGMIGDEGTSGSPWGQVVFSVVQANTSGGGGVKAIAAKTASVTQLSSSPSLSEENLQCVINIDPSEDLDTDAGFYWIAVKIVVSGDTCDAAALLLGIDPKYSPASDNDSAAVNEIIA